MKDQDLYYEESGKIHPLRFVIASVLSIGVAIVLGYVYTLAIVYIPIIYLNFIATLFFGAALGAMYRILIWLSHSRNKRANLLLAVGIGLLANYFQWTAFIVWAFSDGFPDFQLYLINITWLVTDGDLFGTIAEINKVGMWSVFGATVTGFGLTAIWIVEALIIAAGPVIISFQIKTAPYSENRSRWYVKYTLFNDFESIPATTKLIEELKENPIAVIEGLGNGAANRHTKIHVFKLKGEEDQYLTIEKVVVDSREGSKKTGEILVNNFRISKQQADAILEKFEHKRNWFSFLF